MHIEDLPIITEVDKDNGILLYCEDGRKINQLPVSDFKAGVDYSIFEQETGYAWLDGEPIYQISFDLHRYGVNNAFVESVPSTVSQYYTYAVIDVSALGIKQVIDGFGIGRIQKVNGGLIEDMHYGTSRSEPHLDNNVIYINGDNTEIIIGIDDLSNFDNYMEYSVVTIQYIKATYDYYEWAFDPSQSSRQYDIRNSVEMTLGNYPDGARVSDTAYLVIQGNYGGFTSVSNNAPDFTPIDDVYPAFDAWNLEYDLSYYTGDIPIPGIGTANNELHVFTFNDISSKYYFGLKCVYDPIVSPNQTGYVWDWVLGYDGGEVRLNINEPTYFSINKWIKIERERQKISIYKGVGVLDNIEYELIFETTDSNVLFTNFLGLGRVAGFERGDHSGDHRIGDKRSLSTIAQHFKFGRYK